MKQFLKRGLAILTAFILCLQFGKIDAQAANVVIALSASTVSVGNNVTATISVSGSDISAYTIYVSYNSSVLQYNSASGSAIVNGGGGTVTASGTSAGSFSISFIPSKIEYARLPDLKSNWTPGSSSANSSPIKLSSSRTSASS